MDSRRFDSLTAAFTRRHSRRTAIRGAGLTALFGGVAGLRGATAQEATPAAKSSHPSFLFVQTATGGSFGPNPQVGTPAVEGTPTVDGGAMHLLTLEGHNGNTIYFSDRPDRVFGDTPTPQFLDGLGFSPLNPPNAALITQADGDAEDEVYILELVNPTVDEATGTLTYGVNILGGYAGEPLTQIVADEAAEALPETFGRASLFIDECTAITSCIPIGTPMALLTIPAALMFIPSGPFLQCWAPDSGCQPCGGSRDRLNAMCNQTYEECSGECVAG
jgi:hypothetical protein